MSIGVAGFNRRFRASAGQNIVLERTNFAETVFDVLTRRESDVDPELVFCPQCRLLLLDQSLEVLQNASLKLGRFKEIGERLSVGLVPEPHHAVIVQTASALLFRIEVVSDNVTQNTEWVTRYPVTPDPEQGLDEGAHECVRKVHRRQRIVCNQSLPLLARLNVLGHIWVAELE